MTSPIEWSTTMSEAVNTAEELEAQLPIPVGYRVLVALPQIEETFDGTDLLKTDTTKIKNTSCPSSALWSIWVTKPM